MGKNRKDSKSNSKSNTKSRLSKDRRERQSAERPVEDYQKQLRRLASELSLAEARERREIASDLHDHIGQALAYVAQRVSILQGNSIFSGLDEEFSRILSILNQTIRYTRNLTVQISPPILYDLGLPAAIDWQAKRAAEIYDLKVSSNQTGEPSEIADDVRVFVFKAVQELINNVAKHASARKVIVHSNWRDSDFEIVVSDDGRGFDTSSLAGIVTSGSCFGLFNIRERLSYVGGALTIVSSPGGGTRVSLVAPYKATEEGDLD